MSPRGPDSRSDRMLAAPQPGPGRRRRGLPAPVGPRRAWFAFAITAVLGTIAAALLPSPWSLAAGVLAAIGAIGAFVVFVVITVLEDAEPR